MCKGKGVGKGNEKERTEKVKERKEKWEEGEEKEEDEDEGEEDKDKNKDDKDKQENRKRCMEEKGEGRVKQGRLSKRFFGVAVNPSRGKSIYHPDIAFSWRRGAGREKGWQWRGRGREGVGKSGSGRGLS